MENSTAKPAWIFTFGGGHTLTATGESLANRYVRIEGEYGEARDEMVRHFGTVWCDQYPHDSADRAGILEFGLTELPTADWPPAADDTKPTKPTKPVADVKPGDLVWHNGAVREVRYVEPYGRFGRPLYLVVLAGGERFDADADYEAQIATDDEIAEIEAAGRREALANALYELAEAIVAKKLPLPLYRFDVGAVLRTRADLEAWATYLSADVRMGGNGNMPVIRHDLTTGDGPPLYFGLQSLVEPQPAAPEVGAS